MHSTKATIVFTLVIVGGTIGVVHFADTLISRFSPNASYAQEDSTMDDNEIGNTIKVVIEEESVKENYVDAAILNLYKNAIIRTPEDFVEKKESPADSTKPPAYNGKSYDKQFIAISFDGSYSLTRWQGLLDFTKEQQALDKDIRFTFFISGVYFLENLLKYEYQAPGRNPGVSNIGFGGSSNEISSRKKYVERAEQEGHEIGSHANGHFGGSGWSYAEWKSEMEQFDTLTDNFIQNKRTGFRAPLLEKNDNMYKVLAELGYTYDASSVASMNTTPWKDAFGIWHFPLVYLKLGGRGTLSMDYNHYVSQSDAKSVAFRGTPLWDKYYQEVYDAYMHYFNNNYNSHRIPLNIGHHFSWWNDGVYYTALLDFAKVVCNKEDVICGTYSELVELLETNRL